MSHPWSEVKGTWFAMRDAYDSVLHWNHPNLCLMCVACIEKVGVERAEWAAVYVGDKGYCPAHIDGSPDA